MFNPLSPAQATKLALITGMVTAPQTIAQVMPGTFGELFVVEGAKVYRRRTPEGIRYNLAGYAHDGADVQRAMSLLTQATPKATPRLEVTITIDEPAKPEVIEANRQDLQTTVNDAAKPVTRRARKATTRTTRSDVRPNSNGASGTPTVEANAKPAWDASAYTWRKVNPQILRQWFRRGFLKQGPDGITRWTEARMENWGLMGRQMAAKITGCPVEFLDSWPQNELHEVPQQFEEPIAL